MRKEKGRDMGERDEKRGEMRIRGEEEEGKWLKLKGERGGNGMSEEEGETKVKGEWREWVRKGDKEAKEGGRWWKRRKW